MLPFETVVSMGRSCSFVGLLDLYEAGFEERWITWAVELQETQDKLFWDDVGAGYFSGSEGDKRILLRLKEGRLALDVF